MILKIVTSNLGKVEEFRKAFADAGIGTEHVPAAYDEIQTADLEEVVRWGMRELRNKGMKNFIIDDSGLFIDSLKGFPGVYSSYVQKTVGNDGIIDLMRGRKDRGAEFRCCIGCDIKGETIVVTGVCRGRIMKKELGTEGFGFDPIFSADGERTFAELPMEEKNVISHRGIAINLLIKELEKSDMILGHNAPRER